MKKYNVLPIARDISNLTIQQHHTISLPNECLYAIIEYLKLDRKTLYNLLFVNKFFFNAAIRPLFAESFSSFRHLSSSKTPNSYEMTFELSFISFLRERVMESIGHSNSNTQRPSQIVNEFLKKYGLQLITPDDATSDSMLQRICGSEDNWKSFPKSTIDYSIQFNRFTRDDWRHMRHHDYLQLRYLPQILQKQSRTMDSDPNTELEEPASNFDDGSHFDLPNSSSLDLQRYNKFDNENEKHSYEHRTNIIYITALQRAILDMWINYNFEFIATLAITISNAHMFLPYSAKLASLDTLFLDRRREIENNEMEDTISFITQNQTTFPMKKPVIIDFGYWSWDYLIEEHELDDWEFPETMGYEMYINRKRHLRDRILRFTKPMITIYEAVKRPRTLEVTGIPNFYSLAGNIETSQLTELTDMDEERFEIGERESIENFLRRCKNLRILRLSVTHHEAFSWANQGYQEVGWKPAKLEELFIRGSHVYLTGITALMDAMKIFSSTLRTANIWYSRPQRGRGIPNVISNARTWRSLQLQKLESANTIGDFPQLLPFLTTLKITFIYITCLNIGSLDNCPNLEDLEINFQGGDLRPQGEVPIALPGPNEVLDVHWQHPVNNHNLFPRWNLPNLRYLNLKNMAAMRFDFASLPSMQRLEELRIEARNTIYSEQDIDDYVVQQQKIPLAEATLDSHRKYGIFGTYLHTVWDLPNLTSIFIQGPPSAIFCLEHLRLFPRLKTITLDNPSHPVEIHRSPVEVGALPESQEPSDFNCNMFSDTPFMESQLQEFKMSNNFFMSSSNITSILTTYAPFLKSLDVGSLRCNSCHNGYRILEAINNADEDNNSKFKAESATNGLFSLDRDERRTMFLGQRLISVCCAYSLRGREIRSLGLKRINSQELYVERGIRVYQLLDGCYLVRRVDFILE
ncbi:hypothetical protein BGZ76_008195 [Entomortierella beljakovae]|nr:hypothetical protein BGZ76_008195 [Entomortierella beljakovae]